MGGHHTGHSAAHFDRITDRNHGRACVGIDQGIRDSNRMPTLRFAVLLHCPDVEGLFDIVLRDRSRPSLIEASMAHAGNRGRCVVGVDPAHVPVGRGRNARIAAPAVVVDPRHHAVIAVLEAGVDGVNVVGRQKGMVEHVTAGVLTEKARFGCLDGGDHLLRARDVVE
jgi:hypothetical protein